MFLLQRKHKTRLNSGRKFACALPTEGAVYRHLMMDLPHLKMPPTRLARETQLLALHTSTAPSVAVQTPLERTIMLTTQIVVNQVSANKAVAATLCAPNCGTSDLWNESKRSWQGDCLLQQLRTKPATREQKKQNTNICKNHNRLRKYST